MSLNKFTDSTIKQYLSVGANIVNANRLLLNNTDIKNPILYNIIPTITCTSVGSTISLAKAYGTSIGTQMTYNIFCAITLTTAFTTGFVNIRLPLFVYGDVDQDVMCVGNLGNTGVAQIAILQDTNTIHTNVTSATVIPPGTYYYNATYVFQRVSL